MLRHLISIRKFYKFMGWDWTQDKLNDNKLNYKLFLNRGELNGQ